MLNKQLRVLLLRAMIPVGVQNELRVRQVLLSATRDSASCAERP